MSIFFPFHLLSGLNVNNKVLESCTRLCLECLHFLLISVYSTVLVLVAAHDFNIFSGTESTGNKVFWYWFR